MPLVLPDPEDPSNRPGLGNNGSGGGNNNPGGGGPGTFTNFFGGGTFPSGSPQGTGVTPYSRRMTNPSWSAWGNSFGFPQGGGQQGGGAGPQAPVQFGGMNSPQPVGQVQGGDGAAYGMGGPSNTGFTGWGGDPRLDASNGFTNNIFGLLQQYLNGGSFGPGGSQQLMNAVDTHARQQADALNAQAANAANLYGLDPAQQASARLQSLLGNQNSVANILGNANYGQLMNQQQFGQGLLNSMNNYNNQYQMSGDEFNRQVILQKMFGQSQKQQPDYGGMAGGLGTLLGGLKYAGWI